MKHAEAADVGRHVRADRDAQRAFCGPRESIPNQSAVAGERDAVDDVVALVQRGQKSWNLFGRVLEVVVDGDDDLSAGGSNPRQSGRMLSVVPHEVEPADPWIFLGERDDAGSSCHPS